jgi:hypothetical protein
VLAFFVKAIFLGAPGAFFNVGGATVFLTVTAAVKGFLAGAGAEVADFFSTGFLSVVGFFSTAFLATSGSFLAALAGSGFFSALTGSFLSFLTALGTSSAGRFVALLLGSSLTFFGSSFLPLAGGAACC